jgi:hypothetical protein
MNKLKNKKNIAFKKVKAHSKENNFFAIGNNYADSLAK